MTTHKGLNLTPVEAATIAYGLSSSIVHLGTSRYRGPLVLRANKTLPPDGQELLNIGYEVEHRDDLDPRGEGVFLVKLDFARGMPGPRLIRLMPGHIVGSAELVDVEHFQHTRHLWSFKNAKPTTRRCPACDGKGGRCKTCKGAGRVDPIDIGTPVRRAWFSWEPR